MTRTAAARLLGLADRGRLAPGAVADIAVYRDQPDRDVMFSRAELVFKNGALVVKSGEVIQRLKGATQVIAPEFDHRIERDIKVYFDRFYSLSLEHYMLNDAWFGSPESSRFHRHPTLGA